MEKLETQYSTLINHIKNKDIDETSLRFEICDLYASTITLCDTNPKLKTKDIVRVFMISGQSYGMANDLSDYMYGKKDVSLFDYLHKYTL